MQYELCEANKWISSITAKSWNLLSLSPPSMNLFSHVPCTRGKHTKKKKRKKRQYHGITFDLTVKSGKMSAAGPCRSDVIKGYFSCAGPVRMIGGEPWCPQILTRDYWHSELCLQETQTWQTLWVLWSCYVHCMALHTWMARQQKHM